MDTTTRNKVLNVRSKIVHDLQPTGVWAISPLYLIDQLQSGYDQEVELLKTSYVTVMYEKTQDKFYIVQPIQTPSHDMNREMLIITKVIKMVQENIAVTTSKIWDDKSFKKV